MFLVTPASVVASVSSLQPGEWVVQPEVSVESQQPRPFWVRETAVKTRGKPCGATTYGHRRCLMRGSETRSKPTPPSFDGQIAV